MTEWELVETVFLLLLGFTVLRRLPLTKRSNDEQDDSVACIRCNDKYVISITIDAKKRQQERVPCPCVVARLERLEKRVRELEEGDGHDIEIG